MIYNKHLDRLIEVNFVQSFMHQHNMQGKLCIQGDDSSFILHRQPYIVEFHDALIDNYLEISLSDMSTELMLDGGRALIVSVDTGLQNLEDIKKMNFDRDPTNDIFISDGARKTFDLHGDFQAINKLLPQIEVKGGLASMRDGSFDTRFDFKDYIKPMYFGLKEKYLKCLG